MVCSKKVFPACLIKISVLPLLKRMFYVCVRSVWSVMFFRYTVSWLVFWMIYPLHYCWFLLWALSVSALYIFRYSNVMHKIFTIVVILLKQWPFSHYIITFFISYHFYNTCNVSKFSASNLVPFAWNVFFHPFILCVFEGKVSLF